MSSKNNCQLFDKIIDNNYLQLYKESSRPEKNQEELCHSGRIFGKYILYLIEK